MKSQIFSLCVLSSLAFSASLTFPKDVYADAAKEIVNIIRLGSKNISLKKENLEPLLTLKRQGIINSKPELGANYSNYFLINSKINFFGGNVVAIDYEYKDAWIGCCVNPGIVVIIDFPSDYEKVNFKKFAKENSCKIKNSEDSYILNAAKNLLSKRAKLSELTFLDCRESP